MKDKSLFFCGIGGSGMLPLAQIVHGRGGRVCGSDRSRDQGRTPDKFANLEKQGMKLFPQDGSGVTNNVAEVIVSTAVENTIPDVAAAMAQNIPVTRRAELLARLFNASQMRVAIAGTSGKSTITGMVAFVLHDVGLDPTIMNGAVMRDFGASALVGSGDAFVTEADESDGSITLYEPDIALVANIALDHKDMDELRGLFRGFCARAETCILNGDHAETRALAADLPNAVLYRTSDLDGVTLKVPGAHNRSNAAAALAIAVALGVDAAKAKDALSRFTGMKRRLEIVGEANGVTVIDDFAHNPDKVAGSMAALRETPGRLLVMYQPHGFKTLQLTGAETGKTFSQFLQDDDQLYITQPLYLGGTVDNSVGSEIIASTCNARVFDNRDAVLPLFLQDAKPGDRIVIMGARDDTLSVFAAQILSDLSKKLVSP